MFTSDDILKFYADVKSLKLKFPVAEISRQTGYVKGNVSNYLTGVKPPSENFLRKFYEQFADRIQNVSHETPPDSAVDRLRAIKSTGKRQIPFYDAPASGGLVETEMNPIHAPAGTIDVGDLLNDSQAAIRIYGNSMIPNYPPGCVVGLYKVTSRYIQPGEVYVIETREQRLLKRLFYPEDNPKADAYLCYSDNIMKFTGGARDGELAFPPFEIPKEDVINLFVVTGVIKRNANSVIIHR